MQVPYHAADLWPLRILHLATYHLFAGVVHRSVSGENSSTLGNRIQKMMAIVIHGIPSHAANVIESDLIF